MTDARFLKSTAIVPVADLYEALAWYGRTLGFSTDYIHGEGRRGEVADFANYAIMTRDQIEVHLILDEGDGGPQWTRAGSGHLFLTGTVSTPSTPTCKPGR